MIYKKSRKTAAALYVFFAICLCGAFFSCASSPDGSGSEPIEEKTEARTEPVSEAEFAAKINELLRQGKSAEALAEFENMPEHLRGGKDLRMLHISLLISYGNAETARERLGSFLSDYPNDADALYLAAVFASSLGDADAYEKNLNAALKTNPRHSPALAEMGFLAYSQKNWKKAALYFERSLQYEPNDGASLYGLARVQYRSGESKAAEQTLNRALEVDPYNHMALADRAKIKFERGRTRDAIEDIRAALKIKQDDYYYNLDLGRYLDKLGNAEEAIEALGKAVDLEPDYYLAYVYRAGVADLNGYYDQAAADYKKIAELNPDYYFANESLAVLLWRKEDWSGARQNFAAALARDLDNSSYALMTAACMYKENRANEVKKFLPQILPQFDRDSLEYYTARLYLDGAGENDLLLRIQKEKSWQKKAKALFYLALYYEIKGNASLAQKYYAEAKRAVTLPSFFECRLIDWALEI